eukprot:Seg5742.1 transcript_id=Seg5742.1/GoldUCD/mRNA.D3Y31 product=Cyclin-Q protein_id=Seg5742.1/GoldUCD/D3Y31
MHQSAEEDQFYLKENFNQTSLICEACKRLRLSSVTLFMACAIYHRFHQRTKGSDLQRKFKDIDILGPTALYLASKVKEEPLKIRDVINVCYRILHPQDLPLEIGGRYWSLRDSVLNCELFILRVLNFDVSFESPHMYLQSYLNSLKNWVAPPEWNKSNVSQLSWNLLQDSFHLPICIKTKPAILSVAILKTAVDCTSLDISIEGSEKQWWQGFHPYVKETELQDISSTVLQIYLLQSKQENYQAIKTN